MDTASFLRRFAQFKTEGVAKYVFPSVEDIILTISALRGEYDYKRALELYEKNEEMIKKDDLYEGGLLQIIYVCRDAEYLEQLKKYASELRALDPEVPVLAEIQRRFGF